MSDIYKHKHIYFICKRKHKHISLPHLDGVANLVIRFVSELEKGHMSKIQHYKIK